MLTRNQLLKKNRHFIKKKTKTPALRGNPQKSGEICKIFTRSPKKPNSAIRKVIKIMFFYLVMSQNKYSLHKKYQLLVVEAYVPGENGLVSLKINNDVMIRGGRVPDLPGVRYHLIRGKLSFAGLASRKTSRSQYGAKLVKKIKKRKKPNEE